jgi:serine/threonine protein kinase
MLSLQDPYFLVGRTLADKFQIEALVGIGGMGAVYKAHQLAIDRSVAFKILQPNLALGDEQMLTLFEHEARIAGRVAHENVAMVMDAGRTGEGIAYIVMEWLRGRTLEEELAEQGTLNFERTAEILRQVSAALEAAHRSNIVHRDLKPANIMLVRHPDGGEQVKVLDFGIGKVISENSDAMVSRVMGTPHYASPEQLSLGSLIDGRSDIYSLGAMLYRMLTGAAPFAANSLIDLIQMHLTAAPPSLRERRPDASVELEQLIHRLLAKNPNERPGRAGEIPALFEQACATIDKALTAVINSPATKPIKSATTLPGRSIEAADNHPSEREAIEIWEQRIEAARSQKRLGDMLLLAEEAPLWELRFAAHRTAGNALLRLGHFALALEEYEKALRHNPTDIETRRQKGVALGRLKRREEAKDCLRNLINDYPADAHTWGLLGRIVKEEWIDAWRKKENSPEQARLAAAAASGLLREAIEAYLTGFRLDPGDYYPGINALTLLRLFNDLTGADEFPEESALLEGGVRWAIHCALKKEPGDYWARATLGEFELLNGEQSRIERAWQEAVAVAEENWFALDSSQQQLLLLKDLDFRPTGVEAALQILVRALDEIHAPQAGWKPRQVFLFSGHMIDRPNRQKPRFPAEREGIAAAAIRAKLDELDAGPQDLALCSGACGGDLLFAEACLQRGLRLQVRIPFDEPTFLNNSVNFAGIQWRDRYYAMKNHPDTQVLTMPEEVGPETEGSPYARNNLWMMYNALVRGPERVRFICLWDGKEGDGPGGTKQMLDSVFEHSGQAHIIDTTQLW